MKFSIIFHALVRPTLAKPSYWHVAVAYFEDGELQDTWSVVGSEWGQLEAVKRSFLARFPEHVFQTAEFLAPRPTTPETAYGLGRLFGTLGVGSVSLDESYDMTVFGSVAASVAESFAARLGEKHWK